MCFILHTYKVTIVTRSNGWPDYKETNIIKIFDSEDNLICGCDTLEEAIKTVNLIYENNIKFIKG